jgi:uncharacterized glyoxalase superfamily metalloenzyme YdcJ
MNTSIFVSADDLRARFSRAMSTMYRNEVPAYGTLLELVADVNKATLATNTDLRTKLIATDNLERISEERHGAIRLGKPEELAMIRRIFGVMGMFPVAYYDLTSANVPVHSTAFRPITAEALSRSPFRVFTSLLRTELIKDAELRKQAENILQKRDIFPPRIRGLVEKAEKEGGLNETNAQAFIEDATAIFKWHEEAAVSKELYTKMKDADPRVADIVCFKGPHINHLTPRTLDIDTNQAQMPQRGLKNKNVVEGPPPTAPILLRQTSFHALTEKVKFGGEEGAHTARFGEIEQRGAALTKKGRELYDQLLDKAMTSVKPKVDGSNAAEYMQVLEETFKAFPSSPTAMRKEGIAYVQYFLTDAGKKGLGGEKNLDTLIEKGFVDFMPITYEDFLPVSAAGIFASNASGDKSREDEFISSSQEEFEKALGQKVLSEFKIYEAIELESIENLYKA